MTSFAGHTLVSTDSKLQNQRIDSNLICFREKTRPLKISRKPRPNYHATPNFQPIHKFQPNVYSYDKYLLNPFGPYRGSATSSNHFKVLFRIQVLTTSLDDMFKGRSETEDMDKFIPKFG